MDSYVGRGRVCKSIAYLISIFCSCSNHNYLSQILFFKMVIKKGFLITSLEIY